MSNIDLIWVDVETTGLDRLGDRLLEVAVVLTDENLDEIDHIRLPVDPGWRGRRRVRKNKRVQRMHAENGLLAEANHGGLKPKEVDWHLSRFMGRDNGQGYRAYPGGAYAPFDSDNHFPLAGSSVHFDRAFIERDLPHFARYLHYRNVDVSSVKEMVNRWYPLVADHPSKPSKPEDHRALGDIRASIAELRFYRDHLTTALDQAVIDQMTGRA